MIGGQIPCSIKSLFQSAKISNLNMTIPARCILTKFHYDLDIYKVRVEGMGTLVTGTYIIAIDDFQLVDISGLN